MTEHQIEIRTPDGVSDAFLYQPDDGGRWPGVIHLTDIGGIRASHREMAKRLASHGYVVLLPNVFYRTGKPPVIDYPIKWGDERTAKRFAELTQPLTPETIERDGAAYVDWIASQPSVSGHAFGVVGYCFTGAMALRIAAARPDQIAAVASFHGGHLYTDDPKSPHTALPRVKARLYFGHATEDRSMPKEAIDNFERALKTWGGLHESEIYEGAHHGWTVPDNPAYNRPQAERAFEKLLTLFKSTLSQPERSQAGHP